MLHRLLAKLLPLLALLAHATAGEFTVESDVEYGRVNGKPLLLDVYRPATSDAKLQPGVVFVHGGGWAAGNKKDFRPLAVKAAQAGCVAFSVNYRLVFGKENTWPTPLDDCQRAVRWIRENSAKYNVAPHRIGAIGASAGGHLAALLGMLETRDNSDPILAKQSSRVTCVVNLFGPTDLTRTITDNIPLAGTANQLVRGLLGGTPEENPDTARAASPLFQIDAKTAPFLIFHGGKDPIVPPSHSERLDAALRKAGVESKLVMFPEEGHGFAAKKNQLRFDQEAIAFLTKHLAP